MNLEHRRLVRFPGKTVHNGHGSTELAAGHPSVLNAKTVYVSTIKAPLASRVLKSGHNSAKIGKEVVKGKWKGMPIYTLTLEERATCPRSCHEWQICYGNNMPFAHRFRHGKALEQKLESELHTLAIRHHRTGFVVRLHVLGDFYSVGYVKLWDRMLMTHGGLHIFGYTAREDEIGAEIDRVRAFHGERFMIRHSGREAITIPGPPGPLNPLPPDHIICPAQTGATLCCGTCALCWAAPDKVIAFMAH